jgi:hypothetical protein
MPKRPANPAIRKATGLGVEVDWERMDAMTVARF